MLRELTDYEKLRGLLAENPPASAMIAYTLFHQTPEPDAPFRLCLVDDPENPACVLVVSGGNLFFAREPETFDLALEYFGSAAYRELIEGAYRDDPEARAYFLDAYRFAGLEQRYCERLLKLGEKLWLTRCWVHHWDSPPPREPRVPLAPLKPEHARVVEAHWEFGEHDAGSIGYMRWRIESGPTLAFYDERGEPGAWCITHGSGSLGHIYTRRAYRRLGLAEEISFGMVRAVLAGGWLPHAHIKQENEPSLALARKVGLKRGDDVSWIAVRRR
jgi:hypothetical protein